MGAMTAKEKIVPVDSLQKQEGRDAQQGDADRRAARPVQLGLPPLRGTADSPTRWRSLAC
jgi:hypothetical protein